MAHQCYRCKVPNVTKLKSFRFFFGHGFKFISLQNLNLQGNVFTSVCQEFCPRGGVYPSMHWGRHPLSRHTLCPVHSGIHTPPCPVHAGIYPPPPTSTATAADGKHPTGMHSCDFCTLIITILVDNISQQIYLTIHGIKNIFHFIYSSMLCFPNSIKIFTGRMELSDQPKYF